MLWWLNLFKETMLFLHVPLWNPTKHHVSTWCVSMIFCWTSCSMMVFSPPFFHGEIMVKSCEIPPKKAASSPPSLVTSDGPRSRWSPRRGRSPRSWRRRGEASGCRSRNRRRKARWFPARHGGTPSSLDGFCERENPILVGGEWLPSILFSHEYWVSNHPNWRSHIFQRGGPTTNQY